MTKDKSKDRIPDMTTVIKRLETLEKNVVNQENPTNTETSDTPAPAQPMLSDFGLYKCPLCGKMVMGYEKENHVREAHGGQGVEWRRVK
jgi:hypothetical protein